MYRVLRRIRKFLRYVLYKGTLARDCKSSDIYIVEFPKSGITWLSTIIASLNSILLEKEMRITFFNVAQHVADIHRTINVGEQASEELGFRLIKSHDEYNPCYNFVILLIRSPFDVMVSYYRFTQYAGYRGSLNDFIKSKRYGIKAWVRHTESWLKSIPQGEKIHLIRYEDLKENPASQIKSLYENLGFSVPDNSISKALEAASFLNMKDSEAHYKNNNPKHVREFVRKGGSNYELDEESKRYILEHAKSIIKAHYPELIDAELEG